MVPFSYPVKQIWLRLGKGVIKVQIEFKILLGLLQMETEPLKKAQNIEFAKPEKLLSLAVGEETKNKNSGSNCGYCAFSRES